MDTSETGNQMSSTAGHLFTYPRSRSNTPPRDQSTLISAYRERTGNSRRVSLQSRHVQRTNSGSVRSKPSVSSSSGCAGMEDRSLSALANIMSKVSLRSGAQKDEGSPSYAENETFIPNPKITFLLDQPEGMTCQICQSASITMSTASEEAAESSPMILPCGHIGCGACITEWLSSHYKCPFCRIQLTHEGCAHPVQPRLIAQDTILDIPTTLPEGGVIPARCSRCRWADDEKKGTKTLEHLAKKYRDLRAAARSLGTDETHEAAQKAKRRFERFACDFRYDRVSAAKHLW